MTQLQAQIVCHGETDINGTMVEDPDTIWREIAAVGALPLRLLMEARDFADQQAINEALGLPTVEHHEGTFALDANRVEVFVDPDEFLQVGVACVYHRHILVKPVIDVSEMPPLVVIDGGADN